LLLIWEISRTFEFVEDWVVPIHVAVGFTRVITDSTANIFTQLVLKRETLTGSIASSFIFSPCEKIQTIINIRLFVLFNIELSQLLSFLLLNQSQRYLFVSNLFDKILKILDMVDIILNEVL
jgi:hypothetical protein